MTTGTQAFSFERLLEEIDALRLAGVLPHDVYAQTGSTAYQPRHYRFKAFFEMAEFEELLGKCDALITHGGVGTILAGLRMNKKVIAVPRLQAYGEHVDDHQLEIIQAFSERGHLLGTTGVEGLRDAVLALPTFTPRPYVGGNEKILEVLEDFLAGL